jgi:hypothetical protein
MKYFITLFLLLFGTVLFAQQMVPGKKLIQYSGLITDADSNWVVPYVTITNLSNKDQQYAANYKGYFSFVAHPGDTLQYSAIGYKELKVTIPTIISGSSYTAMIKMKSEIINLPTVYLYPWATVEDFTKDFLALKIADDDMEIAKKNLSGDALKGLIQTLPRDGGEIQNMNFRYNHDRELNKNMRQTNPLLNPFAWGKLMQQIFNGDKTRKEGN